MTDRSERATRSQAIAAREGGWHGRAASLRRRLRSLESPAQGLAAFRIWVRGSEVAIVALAILAGGASGLVAP